MIGRDHKTVQLLPFIPVTVLPNFLKTTKYHLKILAELPGAGLVSVFASGSITQNVQLSQRFAMFN
jgi:hypothetical protein